MFLVGSGAPGARLAPAAEGHSAEMREYLHALVVRRRADPGDDLLSAMIAAADGAGRLSEYEVYSNATFLMTAGHETATNMLSNGVLTLLRHPDQFERLRRDASLIPAAAEEILRFESPVQMTPRHALEDGDRWRSGPPRGPLFTRDSSPAFDKDLKWTIAARRAGTIRERKD